MSERYFDDFIVGDKFSTGAVTVTTDMIVGFGLTYDPQPFHIDAEAARDTHFGGLIASGFQTLALGFRLIWDTGIFRAAGMGSPGYDELRWLRPVRPGDTIHAELEVIGTRPSSSKPDRGIARISYRYLNQKGEVVLTCIAIWLLRRRSA